MLRIGEYLVKKGIITIKELQLALHRQLIYGGRLGTNLIKLGLITEEVLISLLQWAHNAKGINLRRIGTISKSIISNIDVETAKKYKCIPFESTNSNIKLAVIDLLQEKDTRMLEKNLGKSIIQYIFPEIQWIDAMKTYYNTDPTIEEDILAGKPELKEDTQGLIPFTDEESIMNDLKKIISEINPDLNKVSTSTFSDLKEIETLLSQDTDLRSESVEESINDEDLAILNLDTLLEEKDFFTDYKEKTGWKRPKIKEPDEGTYVEKISMTEATIMLARARNREQIAITLLHSACNYADSAILFFIKHDQVKGWVGLGKKIDKKKVQDFQYSLVADSLFLDFIKSSKMYKGPAIISPNNRSIFRMLNIPWPQDICMIPIYIAKRIVALLLMMNYDGEISRQGAANMEILVKKASISFEILILKQKKVPK